VNQGKQLSVVDLHGLAPLYALGVLDTAEKIAFEEHLQRGCESCARDVSSFTDITNLIGGSFPAMPSQQLRDRLLSEVSRGPRAPGIVFEQSGLLIARSDELVWQTLAPGISYKVLYEDAARKYNTSLMRMEAGARYSSHHHAAIEELFMLSGDLHVENQVMRAGDYCRADSGSIHGETFSETGCLFLMMASQENQIIENGTPLRF
jgi:quercetin dioxygenase-like cupin family protein